MKKLLIIPILLLVFCDLKGDEFRYRTSFQNSSFIIELQEDHWVLSSLKPREKKYSIKDQGFGTMSILISEDGEKVIVIDDFSVGIEKDNRTVIWLFENGELIRTHSLSSIIDDTCNLTISVSHISWCLSDFKIDSEDNHLSFSTNEMYDFEMNLSDGSLKKYRPIGFTGETLVAYGKIEKLADKRYRLHIVRVLSMQTINEGYLDYTSGNVGFENSVRLIAIEDEIDITPQQYLIETVWLQECKD